LIWKTPLVENYPDNKKSSFANLRFVLAVDTW